MLIENNISNYKFNYVSSDVTEIGNVVGVSPAVSNGTYLGDDVQLVITVRGE